MPPIYVTGHRNPDTDSIASAIGYAELKGRLDPRNEYVPVRLGECNAQTRWVLERSGAPEPRVPAARHAPRLRRDADQFPVTGMDEPIREAGLAMASAELEPRPDRRRATAPCRASSPNAPWPAATSASPARPRPSRTRPPAPSAVVDLLEGELVARRGHARWPAACGSHSMDVGGRSGISAGDVVVVGNRTDAQRLAHRARRGALVVSPTARRRPEDVLDLARERGTAVIVSPLDTYVSGRMITLAAPCQAFMEKDPADASRPSTWSPTSPSRSRRSTTAPR